MCRTLGRTTAVAISAFNGIPNENCRSCSLRTGVVGGGGASGRDGHRQGELGDRCQRRLCRWQC
jgi:hypothetical protein